MFCFVCFLKARVGGDVYLIGTTNVGKSSIFNLLLDSDLCSVKAVDKVEKALTSPVPGTTLNLLKFPIMRPGVLRVFIYFYLRLGYSGTDES
jgi:ribosome biogenesis GTPase A